MSFLDASSCRKALKAHVVKTTNVDPPFVHSLPRLADLGQVILDPAQALLLDQLNGYQRVARYDDPGADEVFFIYPENAEELLDLAEELVHWLIQKL